MSKIQSVSNMLSRAVKRGFVFDYVLFDSWFFSKEILARIESFRRKSIKLIAMVKMGTVWLFHPVFYLLTGTSGKHHRWVPVQSGL